jgi:HlyD family secretion protein
MIARLQKHTLIYTSAGILILIALVLLVTTLNPKEPNWVTATVERGDVSETVSISGFIDAKNTAQLAFPAIGKVTEVFAKEGQKVTQGEVLATLASTQLVAERNAAQAQLQIAQAQYDKLIAGVSTEVKAVSEVNVKNAEQELERVRSVEAQKVQNARSTLLSSDLAAVAEDINEDAVPPLVTGSYACEDEGVYLVSVYSSNAKSGFSYRLSGLETASAQAGIEQSAPLGSCGLSIQFSDAGGYQGSEWTISVPNTQGSSYIANANAYSLALTQQANNVAAAEDARALQTQMATETNADPRSEEVREAQGGISSARARIAAIDAQIDDRSVVAPFDGIVTDVSILRGETAPTTPVVTMLAFDAFELKARLPEIDVTKVAEGQNAEAMFDAVADSRLRGVVSYISPLATNIDGVAYFEATIDLESVPTWIRSGLNADVDIFITQKKDVLRIPKRFITTNAKDEKIVYRKEGVEKVENRIEVGTIGNDGYAEVRGVQEGQVIVAP